MSFLRKQESSSFWIPSQARNDDLRNIFKARFRTRNSQLATRNSKAGFTLLEVLVTLAILSIALIAVLQLLSANLKNISTSEDYVSAVTAAEAKMKEIQDKENLSEGIWSEVTPEGYRIDVSVKETLKDRTQNLNVKLLELDLTIYWTKITKRRSLTLRTMKLVKKQI